MFIIKHIWSIFSHYDEILAKISDLGRNQYNYSCSNSEPFNTASVSDSATMYKTEYSTHKHANQHPQIARKLTQTRRSFQRVISPVISAHLIINPGNCFTKTTLITTRKIWRENQYLQFQSLASHLIE